MAAHVGDAKLQRKQNKKIFKIKEQLARKENVIACEDPTAILCVQNGGLDNGVSREDLHELFSMHGQVEDIIMVPRKPFCFVCYDCSHSAAAARQQLMGHLLKEGKDPSQNITLYPFFVASAPSNVCPTKELPPGLLLLEDFINQDTEQLLMDTVSFEDQEACSTGSSLKHRQVKHYGYEFKYSNNNVDPDQPLAQGIPPQCHEFLQRALDSQIVGHFPDQLTVNRYLPGQGIPPHVDTPSAFEDGIMSLSCGSQVIMDFRHPDGRHLSVLVPPRSLLVMRGESRYVWSHGITPRKSDILPLPSGGITLAARGIRLSFTFRKLSPTAGILTSDKTERTSCLPQTEEEAVALEKQHVHQVYEEIADHFSETRHKPWPQIAKFLMEQEPGSILVDIGCGNGKYFGVNSELCQIGSDRSHNLASIVQSRGHQVFVADIMAIPLRSASVDVAMCIAVIHHLSTQSRRRHAVEELVRILRPGGRVLIYVWALEQQKDSQRSTYLTPHRQHRRQARQQRAQTEDVKTSHHAVADDDEARSSCRSEETPCDGSADYQTEEGVVKTSPHTDEERLSCNAGYQKKPEEARSSRESERGTTRAGDEKNFESFAEANSSSSSLRTAPDSQVLQVHVNRTEFKEQDMLVPWQRKNKQPRNRVGGGANGGGGGGKSGSLTGDGGSSCSRGVAGGGVSGGDGVSGSCGVARNDGDSGGGGGGNGDCGSRSSSSGIGVAGDGGGGGREEQTFHRFYHVFEQGELEALCAEVNGCEVSRSYYDQGNWCVVLQKV